MRAEFERRSRDLPGFADWSGNDDRCTFGHAAIRAADPRDSSNAVRWFGFGRDRRDDVPRTEPSWSRALAGKRPTDANFEEAPTRIDLELADPWNRVLDAERMQRMMIAKYHVYLRWPGHEGRRFSVQREIAARGPAAFWESGPGGTSASGADRTLRFEWGRDCLPPTAGVAHRVQPRHAEGLLVVQTGGFSL